MNIEYILNHIIGGVIIGGFILCFSLLCFNFLDLQNINNYFIDDDYYIINDNQYLLKKNINLCGVDYSIGDIIKSSTYNYCINK